MRFLPWFLISAGIACNGGASDGPKETGSVDTGPVTTDTSDTGAPTTPPEPFEIVDCGRVLTEPPAGQTCAVTGDPATATRVLLQGDVLGDPDVFMSGEIRIGIGDDAIIECVGCDCATADDTLVISCPDAVVSPGLLNAHDHIRYAAETVKTHGDIRYDHRHDWRRGTRGHSSISTDSSNDPEVTLYGELRMLLGGATSIAGSIAAVDASGLLRNLDNAAYTEGLNPGRVDYSTFPLGDGSTPVLATDTCTPYSPESSSVLNNEIYLPHIAEGIDLEARNEFACLSGEGPGSVDYIADNTSIVHGIGLTAEDIGLVASRGAQLVWSPRSNLSLYGDTAPVVTYDRFAVPIALGTDWIPSGSANVLRELACADEFNHDHLGGYFSDFDLWRMATRNGAIAMGVDDQLGRLAEGLVADVAIFANHGEQLHRTVVTAGIEDVALVLRGGRPLTGEAALMQAMIEPSAFAACESLGDCVSDHVVCMDRFSLSQVLGAVPAQAYPLYICDPPADEPSCVPFRNDEDNDGVIYPTSSLMDRDDDGEDDDVDNCPDVFNPRRPLDGWVQPDVDGDGVGDACDVCPLQPGTDCPVGDLDLDGVPDIDDNCPRDANPDQIDADGDGIGAACDDCDDFAAASGACGVSIYDVKQGLHTDQLVVVDDLVVTAVDTGRGWYAQLDPAAASFGGVDFSGVFTYSPDTVDQVAVGDRVRVEAGVQDFHGQLQLSNVIEVQVTGTAAVPLPVLATPEEVRTSGSRADELESVLVRVESAEVTDVQLPAGPGDSDPTNEFELDGVLHVNDALFAIAPAPQIGDTFDAIAGVLRYANDDSKLEPRDASDVVRGSTTVAALDPSRLALEVDATQTMTVSLRYAVAGLTTVQLSCLPQGIVTCPASVDVPAGQVDAGFPIVAGPTAGFVTVTARLGVSEAFADVHVYDDVTPRQVVEIAPAVLALQPKTSGLLVVTLDLPAPTGGLTLPITADAGITVPSDVTFPEGDASVDVPVDAGAIGTYAVSIDGISATVEVTKAAIGEGVAFWEYLEPQSAGNNKFLEIKNLEPFPFDVDDCQVENYVNGGSTPSATIDLDPIVLQPGGIFLLCPSNEPTPFATGAPCSQSASLTFNGDDAQVLRCSGTLMDVIGEVGFDPGSEWGNATVGTQDATLRRDCGTTIGDRIEGDAFDPALEWQAAAINDASNLGLDHCP